MYDSWSKFSRNIWITSVLLLYPALSGEHLKTKLNRCFSRFQFRNYFTHFAQYSLFTCTDFHSRCGGLQKWFSLVAFNSVDLLIRPSRTLQGCQKKQTMWLKFAKNFNGNCGRTVHSPLNLQPQTLSSKPGVCNMWFSGHMWPFSSSAAPQTKYNKEINI